MADELTDKQKLFVSHYLQTLNAAHSARLAGYKGNDVTLASVGYENLRKPHIKEYVSTLMKERAMPPEEVIMRLSRMAEGTLRPFLSTGEALKGEAPKYDLSTPQAQANLDLIKKLKTKTITKIGEKEAFEIVEIDLEIHDPRAALVDLGRHHKLFTDKTEHSGELKVEYDLDAAIEKIYGNGDSSTSANES